MRKKLYDVIVTSGGNNKLSTVYDIFMIIVIVASIVPLAFKQSLIAFDVLEIICTAIFTVDYFLRWITADYKFGIHNALSFLRYPFSLMAIIDLVSILPAFTVLNQGFKLLRILRLFRALRVYEHLNCFVIQKTQ